MPSSSNLSGVASWSPRTTLDAMYFLRRHARRFPNGSLGLSKRITSVLQSRPKPSQILMLSKTNPKQSSLVKPSSPQMRSTSGCTFSIVAWSAGDGS